MATSDPPNPSGSGVVNPQASAMENRLVYHFLLEKNMPASAKRFKRLTALTVPDAEDLREIDLITSITSRAINLFTGASSIEDDAVIRSELNMLSLRAHVEQVPDPSMKSDSQQQDGTFTDSDTDDSETDDSDADADTDAGAGVVGDVFFSLEGGPTPISHPVQIDRFFLQLSEIDFTRSVTTPGYPQNHHSDTWSDHYFVDIPVDPKSLK